MKKYLLLTKILLKSGLGDFNTKKNRNKKKKHSSKLGMKLLYLFVFVCFLPLMASLYMAGKEGYALLSTIGQEGITINLICTIASLMVFAFGMAVVITVYYYTSDIVNLLPLPIKSYHIVGAKFTITLLYEYFAVVFLFVPPLVGYGVASKAEAIYWVCLVLGAIVIPVVPLIYASIFSMLIMLAFKKAKNRDFLTVTSSLVLIIAILGINGLSSSFSSMTQQELSNLLVQGNNSLVGTINIIFPNLSLLEKALVFQSPLYLILYLITVIAFIVVFLFIAKMLYFRGVIGMTQTSSKRKAITQEQSEKIIKKNSAVKTYITKELKILVRTPVYFLNCILFTFIWPLLFVIPFIGAYMNGSDESVDYSMITNQIAIDKAQISALCILMVFLITVFVTSISFSTGTSISREGKNYFYMKYIPLSYEKQIIAKVMSGVIISVIATTLYCLIAMLFLKLPLFAILVSTIISFLACFIFNYIEMLIDIIRPKLNWENEQSAVKQNLNTFIEMFVSVVLGGILVLLGIVSYMGLHLSIYLIGILSCILLLLITIALHKLVVSYGAKKLKEL